VTATSTQSEQPRATGEAGTGNRMTRLLRARPEDPAWARPALAGLLVATALLYMVGLDRNGWGNEFYAAAVQAGTKSWKAFLFGSLDSSNFITVDKPAGFLWVMELSARIFGFNYWSLLIPQALAGVATVGVLYTTVRRWFGASAAIIAGAVMALAPVAALMFRFDDPDALMTLAITLAAYATTRAIESGRTRWLALAGVYLGAGFLAKMLAAFMVLPALALAYLWAGPPKLGKRIWQLLVGAFMLVLTAGWWVAIVLLTPAADRPFVGSSTNNNILNLIFVYNGFGRLTGNGFRGRAGLAVEEAERSATPVARFGGAGSPFGGSTGITRLFQTQYGGQVAWLIPAALVAIVVMLWVSRRAGRTDRTRAAALMWGGWLLVAGLVLSFMSGISHTYYTVALAPAIGALVGIGAAGLWRIGRTWFARVTLAVTLAGTAAWAWVLLGRSAGWFPWVRVGIVIAAVGAVCMILAAPVVRADRPWARTILPVVPVLLALVVGLGGPLAYSIDTAATSYGGASPSAGPAVASAFGGLARRGIPGEFGRGAPGELGRAPGEFGRGGFPGAAGGTARGLGGFGGNASVNAALTRLLEKGAPGYKWAAATVGSDSAASLELNTGGDPVMAVGGFSGSDPAPTLAEFQQMVASHEIHYFVAGAGGGIGGFRAGGFGGPVTEPAGATAEAGGASAGAGDPVAGSSGGSDSSQITSWVESHFTATTVGGETIYNLTTAPGTGS
jgi:4-amino-4-deoxy-L-arabinose transferase-like glycosyltransferase